MEQHPTEAENNKNTKLEGGTYELLQNRLNQYSEQLSQKLNELNKDRKEVFGAVDTRLVASERITTSHNCIPWDMAPVANQFIFGYNVHFGLKTEHELSDVFSVYEYSNHQFHQTSLDLINHPQFVQDFKELYTYYKDTQFIRFAQIGPNLFMVFRTGKAVTDIKTFKWAISGGTLQYIDNRSDHEYRFPDQHAFQWVRTTREMHREGKHPHISIDDRLFVEAIHGDLTIKVEDNTDEGQGIYNEPVDNKDQTLDDAEIFYAIIGNIIVLKVRPYREENYRYILYNAKIQEARRVDELEDACVLLPDDHGLIFSNGYYLQTGTFKQFDNQLNNMLFERVIKSPNGEDTLYIFYNRLEGIYLLLSYNLIEQKVSNPIVCHGYSVFENGELCYFKADTEPKKHHAVQIWQTPYVGANYEIDTSNDSYLFKVGNKDIERAMAECHEVLALTGKDDTYNALYIDLIHHTTDLIDTYHWLGKPEAYNLIEPLNGIKQTATSAVEEFEKVQRIKKNTAKQCKTVFGTADELIREIRKVKTEHINTFVQQLAQLRSVRGQVIGLRELRYVELPLVNDYEQRLENFNNDVSTACVKFLLKEKALQPYYEQVAKLETAVYKAAKVVDANQLDEDIKGISGELEMLIEVVSNLQIIDATETTRIIDSISAVYANFNQIKALLKKRRKELLSVEGKSEFNAQVKLIDQAVINYLDVSDTPQKCDEYLTKTMVQLEELEGKFSEFDDFMVLIGKKREEIYDAFDGRKITLVEERNKRANTLLNAANRILKAVGNRVSRFETVNEINGYFASDLMVEKARNIINELGQLGDTVKADDVQSRLKTAKEDAIRQLKDKSELFAGNGSLIKFGKHQFTVNTQNLGLTLVLNKGKMYYHLTGTNFFEVVQDKQLYALKEVWGQTINSENSQVYRSEYLAYSVLAAAQQPVNGQASQASIEALSKMEPEQLTDHVRNFMAVRYNEGYVKGVHDHDALLLLQVLLRIINTADLLRFSATTRTLAKVYWLLVIPEQNRNQLQKQLKGAGAIFKVFPGNHEFERIKENLKQGLAAFAEHEGLFNANLVPDATQYLFAEMARGDAFVIDAEANLLANQFKDYLKRKLVIQLFEASVKELSAQPLQQFVLIRHWLRAFLQQEGHHQSAEYVDEAAALIQQGKYNKKQIIEVPLKETLNGFKGTHPALDGNTYHFDYNAFTGKLNDFSRRIVPMFEALTNLKKQLVDTFEQNLRLSEFKPRVMSSFVRNKLIDTVYLPLVGDNLAKQIGAAGDAKRTDLMGMLLLISPPGYGKTTLMEYIANRLGIIFMKINGPAIGHQVVSVDPSEATNAASRDELEKLNLAFEMGDNVMIYLDDIQHCNPEFLQKFISLCDAQRKIEGVYKGRSKTYDFRGKKVCVVMAGNPYTESGDKFQIPDMLANRADIYNLGDIIGGTESAFKMSYVENCLTSNQALARLPGKSTKDVYSIIKIAETGQREGIDFEANHGAEEVNEYINVMQKLLQVRDVVLKVNQEYIRSAAQQDEYRTEPAFKLQGSYRNMNKLAEKIVPVMNDHELQTLILSHYEGESQTLTSGAEANMLKFKELIGVMTAQEQTRWANIKATFVKNQKMKGYGGSQVGQVIDQMQDISASLSGIRQWLTANAGPLE